MRFVFIGSMLLTAIAFADNFELKQSQINGKSAVVARIQLNNKESQLKLYWKDEKGAPLKTFERLRNWLHKKNKILLFATNAGIYRDTPSFAPIGLHIENGSMLSRLSFAKGCGNFCWYSGVFLIEGDRASILPREDVMTKNFPDARVGLQSGPLLMRSGKLQGTWSAVSFNLNRSAVCTTSQPGEVFIIFVSDATNLTQFFAVLKEAGCRDALFLDGDVSAFYDGKQRKRLGNLDASYAGMLAVTQ
jgi:uncharacterized protein YigE (DUF2233 family)